MAVLLIVGGKRDSEYYDAGDEQFVKIMDPNPADLMPSIPGFSPPMLRVLACTTYERQRWTCSRDGSSKSKEPLEVLVPSGQTPEQTMALLFAGYRKPKQ